ncbi:hypothetical protein [Lysobacter capsici]|uniref:hypothetical protein n=1 Tax=Lysobacter capsici TaxID=435897 RepID=UPI001C004715|nr:hypothetical protein [Lysobacter capsici]QWF18706.1 hypothetical protein KME82_08175 [Lysobacter capsici]
MCSTPKAKATPTPDLLITRRDGEASNQAAAKRKKGDMRLDLNSPQQYAGLTIPRG